MTLFGLKRIVKSCLVQNYSYYCAIPNCYVCQLYTIIINQMLRAGIFSDLLKISKVISLQKDDSVNFSNYRPISLLPSISKLFEKVIFKQLADYLKENNLMYKY